MSQPTADSIAAAPAATAAGESATGETVASRVPASAARSAVLSPGASSLVSSALGWLSSTASTAGRTLTPLVAELQDEATRGADARAPAAASQYPDSNAVDALAPTLS